MSGVWATYSIVLLLPDETPDRRKMEGRKVRTLYMTGKRKRSTRSPNHFCVLPVCVIQVSCCGDDMFRYTSY